MKPPYQITTNILLLIASISEKIGEVNSTHINKPPTELRRKNRIKTIQSSLEIEGNTLSLEQVTSILEKKRVLGPKKDIIEVKNAISVYDKIDKFKPYNLKSFYKAHSIMMTGLIDSAGKLRNRAVGVAKGSEITHIAPPSDMLHSLMTDLFNYIKNDNDLLLIKSCVFHYELEFIHPFIDGNGRMGRLWQTVILMNKYPVFEFLPIETIIKEKQLNYYDALQKSDSIGKSTLFIEFMLEVIEESLEELLKTQNVTITESDRIFDFRAVINENYFTRKDYLRCFKNISPATASRDLRSAVKNNIITKFGDKNTTKYRYK
ncbi:MAG: Fic family protein [Candidatus Delongbacteria bacterium]|jgi:Fic family protein|nr:Fic family protein [Candidatus Delongbacteria bacterium]